MLVRPTWTEVDLKAIAHNLSLLKKKVGTKIEILSIVKADAYGHGAKEIAKVCEKFNTYLGVALIEEGIALRQHGISAPIVILGSTYPFSNFRHTSEYNLIPTIASFSGAKALSKMAVKHNQKVLFHLKIDTGMGRIGLNPATGFATIQKIVKLPAIEMHGFYTHLSCAETDESYSKAQIEKFNKLIEQLRQARISPKYVHFAGSAALGKYKSSSATMVRPGLMIYGIPPQIDGQRHFGLKPALSFKTHVVYLKMVPRGTSISYGRTYVTKQHSVIATLPVGYADGYPWSLANRSQVLVKGKRVPVIGRICMDMCMADVSGIKGIDVGDEVVLIGRQGREEITVSEVAEWAKTIPYEIVCGISARVPRIYK